MRAPRLAWVALGLCMACETYTPPPPIELARLDEVAEPFEPTDQERAVWEESAAHFAKLDELSIWLDAPELDAYVEGVLEAISFAQLPGSVPKTTMRIVRSGAISAGMFHGGVMVLSTGLLGALENEAQLAFVLGHERAHYVSRDGLRELLYAERTTSGLDRLAMSRALEAEADLLSLQWLLDAGYPGSASMRAIDLIHDDDVEYVALDLLTHPGPEERIVALTRALAARPEDGADARRTRYEAQIVPALIENVSIAIEEDRFADARDQLDRLLPLARDDARTQYQFARYLERVSAEGSRSRDALAAYERAAELAPDRPEYQRALGMQYRARGRRADAALAFRRYLELSPDAADRMLIERSLESAER